MSTVLGIILIVGVIVFAWWNVSGMIKDIKAKKTKKEQKNNTDEKVDSSNEKKSV